MGPGLSPLSQSISAAAFPAAVRIFASTTGGNSGSFILISGEKEKWPPDAVKQRRS